MFFSGKAFLTHTAGVVAANIILNSTFDTSTGWSNLGFSGKSIAGGVLVFNNTDPYDAAFYACTPVAGKYYQMTYTISGYSAGNVAGLIGGTTNAIGTVRTANGTYVERLLCPAAPTEFGIWTQDINGTFNIDNCTLVGPYNTSTVNGS